MEDQINQVRQLANRLECATSTGERVETLQELQALARQVPLEVGNHCLQLLIDLLKEHGTTEEYQEALDLIYRLIKCPKDPSAAAKNSEKILLHKNDNIELLLELLEHKDMVVGITTSQILTEIHLNSGPILEKSIQDCHNGMNKLLQRLPDSSREEIRNQAIVLIQQLTAKNEEMKKTVAFNEGFDILFAIIKSEGGAQEAGMVIQDCLQICCNILSDSQTCQRLFFEMGNGWFLNLSDFFDPLLLEKISSKGLYEDEDSSSCWFDQSSRVSCASLALKALANSLSNPDKKYQNMIGVTSSNILGNALFWLARKGPVETILPALELVSRCIFNNEEVCRQLSQSLIKINPSKNGKNVPQNFDVAFSNLLIYGWKPLPKDEHKFISCISLLAEQYIFQHLLWTSSNDQPNVHEIDRVSITCLLVLDGIFSVDKNFASVMLQYVLAPPPPSAEDDIDGQSSSSFSFEIMKPFLTLILNTLYEASVRAIANSKNSVSNQIINVPDHLLIDRCCNILTLLFVHADHLSRELITAIHTGHTSSLSSSLSLSNAAIAPQQQQLLPFLLSYAGRAARVPNGYTILTSLLRFVSVAVADCDRAVRQILEDPSNLFVFDLPTTTSETSGVPLIVQTIASFFLGICFLSLKDSAKDQNQPTELEEQLSQRSFLLMIDNRIGLTRFTEILKRPITNQIPSVTSELFFSSSFRTFYESKVELVRRSLFDFYACNGQNIENAESSPELQIILMQKKHISDLEKQIEDLTSSDGNESKNDKYSLLEKELESSETKRKALQNFLNEKDIALENMLKSEIAILSEADALRKRAESAENLVAELQNVNNGSNASLNIDKKKDINISELEDSIQSLKKEISQKNKKIELLEENLRSPLGYENSRENKIKELELENERLTYQLSDSEASLSAITIAANAKLDDLDKSSVEYNEFLKVFLPYWREISESASLLAMCISPEATEMISQVGLNIDTDVFDNCPDKSSFLNEKLSLLVSVIQECLQSHELLVGTCSDIAEGAGLSLLNFTEPEGMNGRIKECTEKMAYKLHEVYDELKELEFYKLNYENLENERAMAQEEIFKLADMIESIQKASGSNDSSQTNNDVLIELRSSLVEKDNYLKTLVERHQNDLKSAESEAEHFKNLLLEKDNYLNTLVEKHQNDLKSAELEAEHFKNLLLEKENSNIEQNLRFEELNSRYIIHVNQLESLQKNMLEKENALVNQNNDNQKLLNDINLMTKELDLMKSQMLEKEQLKASNQSEIHRESNAVSEGLKSSNETEIRYKEEEIESYKNEISQLNKQIGNLNEEKGNSVELINKLRKDFKEKVDIVKDLNLLIDKHESEKKALEEQLLVVKSIALSLERELDETRQNLSSSVLNNQKDLSFADYGVDSESVKAESSELKKLSAELVFVESALRSKERELLSALQDGASAAGQISGLNLVIQDMAQEIESLKRENASLEKRLHSQKGVHDILKYDIDNSEKLYQKVLEENESKDKTIILLNDEIKLIKQELKENDAELVQKSKALFENQNNFSNLIEELIEYSHWILTSLSYPEDMLTEFTKSINSNKVKFGNHPITEIISLSKIKVKDSISTLLANSNSESLSLKDKELNDLRNKLEEAYSNIKRQLSQVDKSNDTISVMDTPIKSPKPAVFLKNETPSRWKEVSDIIMALTPQAKDVHKMHADLLKKQRELDEFKEQHSDLLSLLAQQELELGVFRSRMCALSGDSALELTLLEARKTAFEKYGNYTEFRSTKNSP